MGRFLAVFAIFCLPATIIGLGMPADAAGDETAPSTALQVTQVHMGSKFTIVVHASDHERAARAIDLAFERIHRLDLVMSDYLDESELSRLSGSSGMAKRIAVSDELWPALATAQLVSVWTQGSFDITCGPLTTLWRRARRERRLADAQTLSRAKAAVGYQHLLLRYEDRTAELQRPGMRLDLGGIGQGYAADEALRVLRESGFERALVNASGDIAIGEPPPGATGWKIAVPSVDRTGQTGTDLLLLARCAISTSGDTYQAVEIDGRRYGHIVDPATGVGVSHSASATVIADRCILADALATAACVLPGEIAVQLGDRLGVAIRVIVRDGEKQHATQTRRFGWP